MRLVLKNKQFNARPWFWGLAANPPINADYSDFRTFLGIVTVIELQSVKGQVFVDIEG